MITSLRPLSCLIQMLPQCDVATATQPSFNFANFLILWSGSQSDHANQLVFVSYLTMPYLPNVNKQTIGVWSLLACSIHAWLSLIDTYNRSPLVITSTWLSSRCSNSVSTQQCQHTTVRAHNSGSTKQWEHTTVKCCQSVITNQYNQQFMTIYNTYLVIYY